MFFPYATDAPVYYWPVATVGLIVANVVIFLAVAAGALPMDPLTGAPWVLQYGQGLHPEQWIFSPFMHAGPGHLFGNMIFLWVFGLIVEGKLGPARFVPIYLLTAMGECALEQAVMLGMSEGGSLGASSAIYGLMAIAAIWAPENSIQFFFWIGFFLMGTFDIPVLGVAALYIGIDLTIAMLWSGLLGQGITSGLLHLMGVAVGAPIGIILLKRKVIDCEGWDIFSRYGGESKPKPKSKAEEAQEAAVVAERAAQAAQKETDALQAAKGQVVAYLKAGNPAAAAKLYDKMRGVGEGLRLEPALLHQIAKGLQAEGRWHELAPILAELIERAPQAADPLRVTLAQVCVTKLERPGRALELLGGVNARGLNDKQRLAAKQVLARARAMQDDGVVELDDGGW